MATYQKFYTPTDWKNLPNTSTPLNRTNLYHAEMGINEADNRLVQLSKEKADQALVSTLVKDVSLDTKSGILTVTLQNGTTKSYDLDIEKVVTNFDINDDNELVLTLADGTQKVIDLTRFVYSVDSSSTVSMKIQNRTITAEIVDGSVTMEKLDAAIQTEFRQYMLDAQTARDTALQYSKIAKRYSIGEEEFEGSEEDNAKYYYEQSKINAQTSTEKSQLAVDKADIATQQASIATQKAASASVSANNAMADAQIATEKAAQAATSEGISIEKAKEAEASKELSVEKATEAANSAALAKRYAVGGVMPEDTEDNAEWYYHQTKTLKEEVDAVSKIVVPRFFIDFTTGKLKSKTAAKGMQFRIRDGKLYGRLVV